MGVWGVIKWWGGKEAGSVDVVSVLKTKGSRGSMETQHYKMEPHNFFGVPGHRNGVPWFPYKV